MNVETNKVRMWIANISHVFYHWLYHFSGKPKSLPITFPLENYGYKFFNGSKEDMDKSLRTDMRSPFLTIVTAKLTPTISSSYGYQ
jgi:hypothetical protein